MARPIITLPPTKVTISQEGGGSGAVPSEDDVYYKRHFVFDGNDVLQQIKYYNTSLELKKQKSFIWTSDGQIQDIITELF